MASLGALGAIGGAAKGFSSFLEADLAQQREMKLEELKTTNRRETNRMDAEMRNEMALGREDVSQKNRLSLEEMRNKNALSMEETRQSAPTSNQRDLQTLQELGLEDAVDRVYPKASSTQGTPYAKIDMAEENIVGPDGKDVQNEITGEYEKRVTGFNVLDKNGNAQFIALPSTSEVPRHVADVLVSPPEGANIEEIEAAFLKEFNDPEALERFREARNAQSR
jgi:hypothetical protein